MKILAVELDTGHRTILRAVRELVEDGWVESNPRRGTVVCDPSRRRHRGSMPKSGVGDVAPSETRLAGKCASILMGAPSSDGFAALMAQPIEELLRQHQLETRALAMPSFDPTDHNQTFELSSYSGDVVCVINPPPRVCVRFAPTQTLLLISTVPDLHVHATGGFDLVSVDHLQGAAVAGRRLREIGCQSICYVGVGATVHDRAEYDVISAARLRGLEQSLLGAIPMQRQLTCICYDYASAAATVPMFLKLAPRPHGVFAASDELAIGFIAGAAAHGLIPGRDFQIIGFDGQPAGARLASGPLSTIDVQPRQMGAVGGQLLIERLARPELPSRRVLLGCSLIPGRTATSPRIP